LRNCADCHAFVAEKLKSDKKLSQTMANSTHALRENFNNYVKDWQERKKKANGVSEKSAVKVEEAEIEEPPSSKRKILGYGTSVAVD
jgi:hypothetical protein